MRTLGSYAARPATIAATVRDIRATSTTSDAPGVQVSRRDVGGRGEPVGAEPAVVQPHHAFDDRDVGPGGAVEQQRHDPVLPDQVRVEVAARTAGGERVVARVDVVRTDLVTADLECPAAQRRHQPGRHGGLAVRRSRAQRPRAGAGSPLDAPLALLAGVHGVLDLVISVTRSATSTSRGVGVADR